MDWRDTIMTKQQQAEVWLRAEQQAGFLPSVTIEQILDDTTNPFFGGSDQMHRQAIAKRQAQRTWKARDKEVKEARREGRREVVEWLHSHEEVETNPTWTVDWQTKLKEWQV